MKKRAFCFISVIIFFLGTVFFSPRSDISVAADSEPSSSISQAVMLYYTNNTAASLEQFQKLASIDPDNPLIRLNIIRILQETGNYDEACKAY